MRFLIASALMASAAIATPALAQDAPAPDKEFQGFKIVGNTGIDRVNAGGDGETGLSYGGTVGYDYQAGKAVFGIEGGIDGSTTKRCDSNVVVAGDELCARTGRDLYVGGRIGAVVGGKALLYVKGGYTNARAVADYTVGATTTKTGDNLDGVRAGAGVELNVSRNIVGRVEYRYSNYEQDVSRHQALVGLGVKF
ncbi:porin family protein [Sphingomonas bacterium]|uniref:outer membrane protein n=1 Tax=Sphingomonas bacterium TaxID=1895847 RepID=UPI00260285CB|nr:porin family protein [Sphingomonas bacterium]MDB5677302.1 opacity protein [Sphingomonas bacterium]